MTVSIRLMASLMVFASLNLFSTHMEVAANEKNAPDIEHKNETGMTNKSLDEIIRRIAKNIEGGEGFWRFHIADNPIIIITDEKADRMRIISPIVDAAELDSGRLLRLMQANFDSALDARYSIAKNTLWSTFIHSLTSLSGREFLSGLGQVVNLVNNYGSSYSSGAMIFQGGDSKSLRERALIEDLIKRGLAI